MELELRYFDGCPYWKTADERLQRELAAAGHGGRQVRYREVATAEEAGAEGSPSVAQLTRALRR